jgi:Cu(I)/Ag(I) efflux system membrane protein CusA/SilA
MIERIIEFSIRNRFVVILATLGITIWGIHAVINTPVDAIPDLSENQVIVFTDWMGRSPKEIEDQITYPLSVNLQGLAGVKAVRSSSEFNFSMINIIFEDNIDFYFARERVLERLTLASTFLPPGVVPYMAPDATALGQIFWYTVEGQGQDLGRLRAIQDWYVRYQLNSVPGVAQVASAGGFPIEYQIDVDPNKLRAYNVTLGELFSAVARSNSSVGGKVVQKGNAEYIIRGVGWIENTKDIEKIVVKADPQKGTPICVSNLAVVSQGSEFRRSALEKNGNEAVGAVVMMRHGENPLEVTRRIKAKIQELQPGLPEGVRIVPFYDRTRLIHGAIETVTDTLRDEMIIASLAILLILMHLRSAILICMTLPLAVLVSFILMRHFNIASNIMSLSGIAISIGILVDQAIVMVENATHHLTAHFGHNVKITGDTREIVIPACRMVGRPIFFSVIIILLSFIPVFALTGQEGKNFHPLAFTKSFAMIGVAILSITLVPALIPTFIKGRLRAEEDSWLVRNMIAIYKPWLTWLMPRWNLAMWAFSALLILGAGLFPINAIVPIPWHWCFLFVVGLTMAITVIFTRGARWQLLSFVTLAALALTAYGFPKIGVDYMPPLDEGSILDMPVTVPRASVTQTTDDLKARDALLRRFPEVELIVGKSGRADTPTDPSPLDMVESVITLRPKDHWPKRKLRYRDAEKQTAVVLAALQDRHLIGPIPQESDRHAMLDPATMNAATRMDEAMREMTLQQFSEFETALGPQLLDQFIAELVGRWQKAGRLLAPLSEADMHRLAGGLRKQFATILAAGPGQEDVNRLMQQIAEKLAAEKKVELNPELLAVHFHPLYTAYLAVTNVLGSEQPTLFTEMFDFIAYEREKHWRERVRQLDHDIFPRAIAAYDQYAIEELHKLADEKGLWAETSSPLPKGEDTHSVSPHPLAGEGPGVRAANESAVLDHLAQRGPHPNPLPKGEGTKPFPNPLPKGEGTDLRSLHEELDATWSAPHILPWDNLFLWKSTMLSRKKSDEGTDLLKEIDSVVRMPGWANIWTQPIINRIDMLATGVRTMIGVKVFGNDLDKIQEVSEQVAEVLKQIPGAVDVFPDQSRGKGYLEIKIDRDRAARYGVNVGDVQDVIETALGGRAITMTVEGRERFPVRVRYARTFREDEEDVKNLLVNAATASMGSSGAMGNAGMNGGGGASPSSRNSPPVQVPLAMVADVKIVEGPAMIKSENGMLRNYVQLNVRDRDVVGFVEEAQRVVAQKVKLPQGMYLAWSGQFENQVRAGKTMLVVFPAVILVIFVILFLTYNDLIDALLMMKAVPEAMVGGIFLLWLFDYHFSVAVQVGFIACFGMATETGIIMLVYLRDAVEKRGGLEHIRSLRELRHAVIEGAVHRLRPKLLTEGVAIIALAPMLWATGVGHEIISAMAAPVLGGLLIADEVVDIFIPVRFYWVRRYRWLKMHGIDEATAGYDEAVRPHAVHENGRATAEALLGREREAHSDGDGTHATPQIAGT